MSPLCSLKQMSGGGLGRVTLKEIKTTVLAEFHLKIDAKHLVYYSFLLRWQLEKLN